MRLVGRLVVMLAASAVLAGCDQISFGPGQCAAAAPAPAAAAPAPAPRDRGRVDYMADASVRGDEETAGQGAVDIALEWSKKYAKAAEELLDCQKVTKELSEENRKLLGNNARIQMQLEQSQKELAEANQMLVEMGKELREWKTNVLGFRSEMQQAQQVQMEAIKKIMMLLGGEMAQPGTQPAARQISGTKEASSELSKGPNS